MRLSVKAKGLIVVAIPLLAQFIFVFALLLELDKSDREIAMQEHEREVVSTVDTLLAHAFEASAALYTYSYTVQANAQAVFTQRILDMKADLKKLKRLRSKENKKDAVFEKLTVDINEAINFLSHRQNLIVDQTPVTLREQARALEFAGRLVSSIRSLGQLERARVESMKGASRNRQTIKLLIYIGILVNAFLAFLVATYFVRSIEYRIKSILNNFNLFATKRQLLPPLPPDDEISQIDTSFQEMAVTLKKAEASKQEFIAMISHDIRTPLTSIRSMLELLKNEPLENIDEDLKDLVQKASNESRRLIALTNNLIDSAQIEAHRFEIISTKMPIDEAINQAISSVKSLAQSKSIEIVFSPGAPLASLIVDADYDRILQVLVNLLSNAVKYSPANTKVEIRTQNTSDEFARIEIEDQGLGVSDAEKRVVFEAFFRSHETTDGTSNQEGSGLGLAICKSIIETHGGEIGIDNGEKNGSIFWFTLRKA